MDLKKYCERLTQFKDRGVRFGSYMGRRWFISKLAIAVAGVFMVLHQDETSRMVGILLLGYLLGVVSANTRSFLLARTGWELEKEVVDWKKVESVLTSTETQGTQQIPPHER